MRKAARKTCTILAYCHNVATVAVMFLCILWPPLPRPFFLITSVSLASKGSALTWPPYGGTHQCQWRYCRAQDAGPVAKNTEYDYRAFMKERMS